jgi:hypothetical protein
MQDAKAMASLTSVSSSSDGEGPVDGDDKNSSMIEDSGSSTPGSSGSDTSDEGREHEETVARYR